MAGENESGPCKKESPMGRNICRFLLKKVEKM